MKHQALRLHCRNHIAPAQHFRPKPASGDPIPTCRPRVNSCFHQLAPFVLGIAAIGKQEAAGHWVSLAYQSTAAAEVASADQVDPFEAVIILRSVD